MVVVAGVRGMGKVDGARATGGEVVVGTVCAEMMWGLSLLMGGCSLVDNVDSLIDGVGSCVLGDSDSLVNDVGSLVGDIEP